MNLNDLSVPHQQVIEMFKDQLLIVLIKRMGGKVSIPVAELDDTGKDNLAFSLVDRVFHFEAQKK